MIKNIHLSALGLSIACLLTVTGCDKFGSKKDTTADKTKDTSGQTATTNKAPVNVKEVCAESTIPTNLEKSLKDKFVQQSTAFIVAQNSDINLDTDKVKAESDKIVVNVSDVKAVEGATVSANGLVSCQANVSLELPEDMVSRANEIYKANNQNDDVLDANRIKDEAFAFTVNTNVKENNLQILGQSALLGVVSNTLANSTLKTQGGGSKSSSSSNSNTSNNSVAPAVAPKQNVASKTSTTTTAEEKAAAKKRAQQRALAKKRAQQKALAKKRAQQKALAKKRAEAKAKTDAKKQTPAQQKAVAKTDKQTTQAKAEPQQKAVVNKKANESSVIKAQRAKENIKDPKQLKQKLSVETQKKPVVKAKPVTPVKNAEAPAPSKPLGVKNAENIEVVIVEEDGTY